MAEIVELTLHAKPEGEKHWSCRSMAKRAGVSSASVQRTAEQILAKVARGRVALQQV